jgi:vesicle transport protein SEC22
MTKNIDDLLYRGDSLERMGDISSRLREDSRKYKKAAVRINWELLLKQVRRVLDHMPLMAESRC